MVSGETDPTRAVVILLGASVHRLLPGALGLEALSIFQAKGGDLLREQAHEKHEKSQEVKKDRRVRDVKSPFDVERKKRGDEAQ